jgi:hypothetical protein
LLAGVPPSAAQRVLNERWDAVRVMDQQAQIITNENLAKSMEIAELKQAFEKLCMSVEIILDERHEKEVQRQARRRERMFKGVEMQLREARYEMVARQNSVDNIKLRRTQLNEELSQLKFAIELECTRVGYETIDEVEEEIKEIHEAAKHRYDQEGDI